MEFRNYVVGVYEGRGRRAEGAGRGFLKRYAAAPWCTDDLNVNSHKLTPQ